MAIAFDVKTFGAAYTSIGTQTVSHAAAAGARAAIVLITQNGATASAITSVTYGGTAMNLLRSDSEATEAGRVFIYWLDNIAGGTQDVAMVSSSTTNKRMEIVTVTVAAGAAVAVVGTGDTNTSASGSNPSLTLTGLTASTPYFAVEVIHSGLTTMTNTPQTTPAWTLLDFQDIGAQGRGYARINNTPSGTTIIGGWIAATADDYVISGAAFYEDVITEKSSSDTGTGTDAVGALATDLTASETGAGVDNVGADSTKSTSDTATGTDALGPIPPTLVSWAQSQADGVYTTGLSKTLNVVVQAGDLLITAAGTGNQLVDLSTCSGGGLTWNLLEDNDAGAVQMASSKMWAATATATTTVTVEVTASNSTYGWGMGVWVWRGHGGYGESIQGDSGNTQTAVTLPLVTTASGSAIAALVNDWSGSGARAWSAIDGQAAVADATVPATDGNNTLFQTAHWTRLGGAGSKTVAMSGTAQRWNMVAVEILSASTGLTVSTTAAEYTGNNLLPDPLAEAETVTDWYSTYSTLSVSTAASLSRGSSLLTSGTSGPYAQTFTFLDPVLDMVGEQVTAHIALLASTAIPTSSRASVNFSTSQQNNYSAYIPIYQDKWTFHTTRITVPAGLSGASLQAVVMSDTHSFYLDCAGYWVGEGPRPNLLTEDEAYGTGIGSWANISSATIFYDGTVRAQCNSTAAGHMIFGTGTGTSGKPVTPGLPYSGRFNSTINENVENVHARIYWWKSNGAASDVTPYSAGDALPESGTFNTQHSILAATAPSDAAYATLAVYVDSPVLNEVLWIHDAALHQNFIPTAWDLTDRATSLDLDKSSSDTGSAIDALAARDLAAIEAPTNLVTYNQASLELGTTDGWVSASSNVLTASTDVAKSGTYSLKAVATGGAQRFSNVYSTRPGVIPGVTYTARASMRAGASNNATDNSVNLWIEFYNSSNAVVGSKSSGSQTAINSSGWTDFTVSMVAPATAASARIICYRDQTAVADATYYIDETGIFDGAGGTWVLPGAPSGAIHFRDGGGVNLFSPNLASGGDALGNTTGTYVENSTVSYDTTQSYSGAGSFKWVTTGSGTGFAETAFVANVLPADTEFAYRVRTRVSVTGVYAMTVWSAATSDFVVYDQQTLTADQWYSFYYRFDLTPAQAAAYTWITVETAGAPVVTSIWIDDWWLEAASGESLAVEASAAEAKTNLLTANQSSFETSAYGDGFPNCTVSRSTATALDGSASMYAVQTGGTYYIYRVTGLDDLVAAHEGETLTFVLSAKAGAASSDSAAMQIETNLGNWSGSSGPLSTSGWSQYYYTGVIPAGITNLNLTGVVYDSSGTGSAYFDCAGIWVGTTQIWVPGGSLLPSAIDAVSALDAGTVDKTASDTGSATDMVTARTQTAAEAQPSAIEAVPARELAASETPTNMVDTPTVRALVSTDTGAATDTIYSLDAGLVNVATDTGTGTETVSLAVDQSSAEIGTGTDSSLWTDLVSTDTGSSTDAATDRALLGADTAVSAETPALTVDTTTADTGTAIEGVAARAATSLECPTNLLTYNQATAEGGLTGFSETGTTTLTEWSTDYAYHGTHSIKTTRLSGSYSQLNVIHSGSPTFIGRTVTHFARIYRPVGSSIATVEIYHTNPSNVSKTVDLIEGAWTDAHFAYTPTTTDTDTFKFTFTGDVGDFIYFDTFGRWYGSGGTWALPGEPINADLGHDGGLNLLSPNQATGGDATGTATDFVPWNVVMSYDTSQSYSGAGSIKAVCPGTGSTDIDIRLHGLTVTRTYIIQLRVRVSVTGTYKIGHPSGGGAYFDDIRTLTADQWYTFTYRTTNITDGWLYVETSLATTIWLDDLSVAEISGAVIADVSAPDTGTASDAATARTLIGTETATGTDADTDLSTGTALSASDTGTVVDASTTLTVLLVSADTGSGTDASLRTNLVSTDTGSATDTVTARTQTSTDTGSGIDASAARALTSAEVSIVTDVYTTRALATTETGSALDAYSSLDAGLVNLATDTASAVDTHTVLTVLLTSADTSSASDAHLLTALNSADTGTAADAATVAAALSVTETGTGTDTLTLHVAALAGADTGTGADLSSLDGGFAGTVSDTGSATDALTARALFAAEITDFYGSVPGDLYGEGYGGPLAVDAVSAREISSAETASGAELTAALALASTDTGSSIEDPNLNTEDSKNASEVGAALDDATVLLVTGLSSADTGSTADAVSLAVSRTVTETGTSADTVTVRALGGTDTGSSADALTATSLAFADTATAADTSTVLTVVLTNTEAGAAADTASLAVAFTRTETGSGTDSAALAVVLAGTDPGSGLDVVALAATVSGTETGTSLEEILARGLYAEQPATGVDVVYALDGSDSFLATEIGTGTEAVTARALLAVDLALADDVGSLDAGAVKSASDVATTTEAAVVAVVLGAADTGSSTEILSQRAAHITDTGSSTDLLTTRAVSVRELAAAADRVALRELAAMETGSAFDYGTLGGGITGVWFEWSGATEIPLVLEGEWNGASVVPLVLETVT